MVLGPSGAVSARSARLGSVRLGPARLGPARLGSARLGSAPSAPAWLGPARLISARLVFFQFFALRTFQANITKNLGFYDELYTVRLGTILGPFWHREGSMAEPSRAEQSRAEPSRAEPSRAEPGRAEPSRSEPSRAGPGRAEPGRAGPSRASYQNLWLRVGPVIPTLKPRKPILFHTVANQILPYNIWGK